MDFDSGASVALYWDFENLHASLLDARDGAGTYRDARRTPQEPLIDIAAIMEFAMSFGPLAINRAYANWLSFSRYRHALLEHAVELIQLFPPGPNAKNGADIRLCLDAAEEAQRFAHIGTVIVVGGDSDYMPLAAKVKAAGRALVGIGSQGATNMHWARSCRQFKFYETLAPAQAPVTPQAEADAPEVPESEPDSPSAPTSAELPGEPAASPAPPVVATPADARALIRTAVLRLAERRGEPWVQKAALRPMVKRLDPTFDETAHGFSSFAEMLDSYRDTVEIRKGEFDHEVRLTLQPT